jgi:hypothetical protein
VQIDSILDMQHNTDCLLNHTEFKLVSKPYLDMRAASRNIMDLVPFCSENVKALACAFTKEKVPEIPVDLISCEIMSDAEDNEVVAVKYPDFKKQLEQYLERANLGQAMPQNIQEMAECLRQNKVNITGGIQKARFCASRVEPIPYNSKDRYGKTAILRYSFENAKLCRMEFSPVLELAIMKDVTSYKPKDIEVKAMDR